MGMSKWTTRWKTKSWLRDSTLVVALIVIAQAACVTAGKERGFGHWDNSEHPASPRGVWGGLRKHNFWCVPPVINETAIRFNCSERTHDLVDDLVPDTSCVLTCKLSNFYLQIKN